MPARYSNREEEYQAAVTRAALRDASHLGRILFRGEDHLDFLHRMSTNDFAGLRAGSALEAVLTDSRGRIIEFGSYYRSSHSTLAVTSPAGRVTVPEWLDRYLFSEDVVMEDLSGATSMLELFGPETLNLAAAALDPALKSPEERQLFDPDVAGGVWIMKMRRFGFPGLRIVAPTETAAADWKQLLAAGARPIGEEAYEILRIEGGEPAIGSELTTDYNPWEAGLDAAIHMDKGCYLGQEVIARLDTYDKVKQHLVGLLFSDDSSWEAGSSLFAESKKVGRVTSAGHSPRLGRQIGMGYARNAYCSHGTKLAVAPDAPPTAEVGPLPFPTGAPA